MTVFPVFLAVTTLTFIGAAVVLQRRPRHAAVLALRGGLATLFLITGTTHFVVLRADLIAMVPPALPAPELLVTVTGVLELLGAVGLLVRGTAGWAAGGLALLLLAMFPANVHAASAGLSLGGEPATALLPRAAMQVVYLAAALTVAAAMRRAALRPGAQVSAAAREAARSRS